MNLLAGLIAYMLTGSIMWAAAAFIIFTPMTVQMMPGDRK